MCIKYVDIYGLNNNIKNYYINVTFILNHSNHLINFITINGIKIKYHLQINNK